MGWTDREPYFSMLERRTEELIEHQRITRSAAWDKAYEEMVDALLDGTVE